MNEYHIKVRSLAKGCFTFECDVTTTDMEMTETIRFSDELVDALKTRYPLITPEKNEKVTTCVTPK